MSGCVSLGHRRRRSGYPTPALSVAVLLFALAAGLAWLCSAPAYAATFVDVPESHPQAEAVEGMASGGIISGYEAAGGREFRPGDAIKRAQFAKMIVGALGIPVDEDDWTPAKAPFDDLGSEVVTPTPGTDNLYPHEYVAVAYENGITAGKTARTFAPYDLIKRAQVITMVVRAIETRLDIELEEPYGIYETSGALAGFADADHGHNAHLAEWNGLLAGIALDGWDPWGTASRAEVAQILWNMMVLYGLVDTIELEADGSGDYPDLATALLMADPGATIVMGPGIYALKDRQLLFGSIRLVGAGPTQTIVSCGDEGYVFWAIGPKWVIAEGVTIRHQGVKPAWGAIVEDGWVKFDRCRFTGGTVGPAGGDGGSGLVLFGDTSGWLRDCKADANQLDGVTLDEQASVLIDGGEYSGNALSGVAIYMRSAGVLLGVSVHDNGENGVFAVDESQVLLEDCQSSENGLSGVDVAGTAGAVVQLSRLEGNAQYGIEVAQQATAVLRSNTCAGNHSGVIFWGGSTGQALGNRCEGNTLDGISVRGSAAPLLDGNTCVDNGRCGILFADQAGGTARGNTCSGNTYGIGLDDAASPALSGNTLSGNSVAELHDLRD